MENDYIISLCSGFLTPQVFYLIRWWKLGKGGEKLLRHIGYAFFVGFMAYLLLFMITKLYDLHILVQILISLFGSFLYLKSDYYFHFIKGVPPPQSNKFFIGGFWKDPESIDLETQDLTKEIVQNPNKK